MRIDNRSGSQELIAPLRRLGVAAEETTLSHGDVEILIPDGPSGPLLVGVEYKKLPDLLACVRSGRFADQLRGMRDSYEINWLLIEGRVDCVGPKQVLKYKTDDHRWRASDGRVTYAELVTWTMTMCMRAGVLVWRTETQEESVSWLRGLNVWCTGKEWSDHRAHLDWYTPPLPHPPWEKPSTLQKVAAQLPGVGAVRSGEVAKYFKSIQEMACALPEDWVKIPGVGKTTAAKIVKAVKG